jgi:hypothetical protein
MTNQATNERVPAIDRSHSVKKLPHFRRPTTELWKYPVEIETGVAAGLKCIRNSREAIASLAIDSPKGEPDAGKAKEVLLQAVSGVVPGESAAGAFRFAARSAGMLRE